MARRPAVVAVDLTALDSSPSVDRTRDALEKLRNAGVQVVAVSESDEDEARRRLHHARSSDRIDRIERLDRGEAATAAGWIGLARLLGVAVQQLAVIALDRDLIEAARGAGATPAWVTHPPKTSPWGPGPAEIRGPELGSVVDQLLALPEALDQPPAGL